jgi:hypothetical protein
MLVLILTLTAAVRLSHWTHQTCGCDPRDGSKQACKPPSKRPIHDCGCTCTLAALVMPCPTLSSAMLASATAASCPPMLCLLLKAPADVENVKTADW